MSEGGKNKGSQKNDSLNKPVRADEKLGEAGGSVRQKSDEPPKRTDEKLGEIAGVSGKTVDRVETILNKGTPEDIKQVREAVVNA